MNNDGMKEKTQVYNVVILDKSGSMSSIRRAAVDGFNETLAGIQKAQEKFSETQQHYISLVAFCSCEMRKLYDKTPVAEALPLDYEEYQPCCCTPLYDAMGFTLTDIRKHVAGLNNAMVVVTRDYFYRKCYPLFKSIFDRYYTDCESCKEFDEIYLLVITSREGYGKCKLKGLFSGKDEE